MIDEAQVRRQVSGLIRECLLSLDDVEKTKAMFTEFMEDKNQWNKFLLIVAPNLNKESLEGVPSEEFAAFKKILFEEIYKWKPGV